MKLFIRRGNSSESWYDNKKMALFTGKTREADDYYFPVFVRINNLNYYKQELFFSSVVI